MHYIHILLVLMTPLVSLPNCRISFRKGYFSRQVRPPADQLCPVFTSQLHTMPASGTYRGAAFASTLPSRCQLADRHRCQHQHHLPCTAPASNPLMELAASMARWRNCTDSSSKLQTVRFGSWTYFTTSRVMVR